MSITSDMLPFSVTKEDFIFVFEPQAVGFSVYCANVDGVAAEGDTFKEAVNMAVSCARDALRIHAEIATEKGKSRSAIKARGAKPDWSITRGGAKGRTVVAGGSGTAAKAVVRSGKRK